LSHSDGLTSPIRKSWRQTKNGEGITSVPDPDSLIPDPDSAFLAEYQSGSGSGVFMTKIDKNVPYSSKISKDSKDVQATWEAFSPKKKTSGAFLPS
jgi:hypothetical protein